MSQLPQYPTDKERLVRIETILIGLSESMKRIEGIVQKHIDDSVKKEQELEERLSALASAEGDRLKATKYRVIDYILFAILGGVIGYITTLINKVAGS